MITEELVDFIKRQKNIGVSDETLFSILEPQGWTRADYQEALKAVDAEAKEVATPLQGVQMPVQPAVPEVSLPPDTPPTNQPTKTFVADNASNGAPSLAMDDSDAMVDLSSEAIRREPMQARELGTPTEQEMLTDPEEVIDISENPAPVGPPPSVDVVSVMQRGVEATRGQVASEMPATMPEPLNPVGIPSVSTQATPLPQEPTAPHPVVPATMPSPVATPETTPTPQPAPSSAQNLSQSPMTPVPAPAPAPQVGQQSVVAPQPTTPAPMQTISDGVPADLSARGKKSHPGKVIAIVLVLLLVVATVLQLVGLLGIPGLPVLVQNNAQTVREAYAFVATNDDLGAIGFQATLQMDHTDPSQSISATLGGQHEFFSADQHQGIYSFRIRRGPVSAAGEVRFRGDQLWLRFLEAGPQVFMMGLRMDEYINTWFAFDMPILIANGSLLLDPDQVLPGTTSPTERVGPGALVSEALLPLLSSEVDDAEDGNLSSGQKAVMITPSEDWARSIMQRMLVSFDFILGGYADSAEISSILESLRAGGSVLVVNDDGAPVTFSVPLFAQASDMGELSGGLEIQFAEFNQPVDVESPGVSMSFSDFLDRGPAQSSGLVINGSELLRRTLQDARINTVIDAMGIASRGAQIAFQESGTYQNICQSPETLEVYGVLVDTFPEITPDCVAGETEFMFFTAFDGGYVCADSARFVGLLDRAPTGLACAEPIAPEPVEDLGPEEDLGLENEEVGEVM